jgi:hypothetical protein
VSIKVATSASLSCLRELSDERSGVIACLNSPPGKAAADQAGANEYRFFI